MKNSTSQQVRDRQRAPVRQQQNKPDKYGYGRGNESKNELHQQNKFNKNREGVGCGQEKKKSYQQPRSNNTVTGMFAAARSCDDKIAHRFFEKLNRGDDILGFLLEMTKSSDNKEIFRNVFAFASTSDPEVFEFLGKLGKDNLSKGNMKCFVQECCEKINESGFLRRVNLKELSMEFFPPVAWLVVFLFGCDLRYREDEKLLGLAVEIRKAAPQYESIFITEDLKRGAENMSISDIKLLDPLHDNDHPFDFRQVLQLPTVEELQSDTRVELGYHDIFRKANLDGDGALLNKQFRFLREDMIRPLKDELSGLISDSTDKQAERKKSPQNSLFTKLGLKSIGLDYMGNPIATVDVTPPNLLLNRLKKLSNKKENVKEYLKGCREIAYNSIVIFLKNDTTIVGVSTVGNRDFCQANDGAMTINIDVRLTATLMEEIVQAKLSGTSFADSMLVSRMPFFAYEHTLSRLQELNEIAFREEIVGGSPPLDLSPALKIPQEIKNMLKKDPSQLKALTNACSKRLCAIQGPPGTGKTYIGVQIAKTILDCDESSRLLCLTYTNHAVDSFVGDIIDSGISKDIVRRLGSTAKVSDAIKPCCLDVKGEKLPQKKFVAWKSYKAFQNEKIKEVNEILDRISSNKKWDQNSWKKIERFLQEGEDDAYSELCNRESHSGENVVGAKGKKQHADHTYRRWYKGERVPGKHGGLWELSVVNRRNKLEEWNQEMLQQLQQELKNCLEQSEKIAENIKALDQERLVEQLSDETIRVLSCTTSGAAKFHSIISQYEPTAVIVEEAGELLEAHVLVNLFASVKQLVLIGDHKQLRPKLQVYELTKASNRCIDFDVSLFERLVTSKDFPVCVLNKQHRMRPEISEIVRRTTYPSLEDDASVADREDIKGLSQNMMFVNHANYEDERDGDESHKASHQNRFEAQMTVKTVCYLMKQGYSNEDIVVLTPYLGQLLLIKELLAQEKVQVEIGALDEKDIADVDSFNSQVSTPYGNRNSRHIRVATIDNFQGEESKIIVASLVRSNNRGKIGFLAERERVNVLCSRARDGMVMFGNAKTLRSGSAKSGIGNEVLSYFEEKGCLHNFLRVECSHHKQKSHLKTPEDFNNHCPDGGCSRPCNQPLPSCPHKHPCNRKCHPTRDHSGLNCLSTVQVTCQKGVHKLDVECWKSNKRIVCNELVSEKCDRNLHDIKRKCDVNAKVKCKEKTWLLCSQRHHVEVTCHLSDAEVNEYCMDCKSVREESNARAEKEKSEIRKEMRKCNDMKVSESKKIEEIRHRFKLESIKNERKKTEESMALMDQHTTAELLKGFANKESKSNELASYANSTESIINGNTLSASEAKTEAASMIDSEQQDESCLFTSDSNAPVSGSNLVNKPVPSSSERNDQKSTIVDDLKGEVSMKGSDDTLKSKVERNACKLGESKEEGADLLKTIKELFRLVNEEKWVDIARQCSANDFEHKGLQGAVLKSFLAIAELELEFNNEKEVRHHVEAAQTCLDSFDFRDSSMEASDLKNITKAVVCYAEMLTQSSFNEKLKAVLQYIEAIKGLTFDFPKSWDSKIKNVMLEECHNSGEQSKSSSSQPSVPPESKAKVEWESFKSKIKNASSRKPNIQSDGDNSSSPSESIDELMKMIGLEALKNKFVEMYHSVQVNKARKTELASSYNARFEGNPGTGKTTVARLYARFLIENSILPEDAEFMETSGSKLKLGGVKNLQSSLDGMKDVGGGVIFVDEAYQLNPQSDRQGEELLNFILANSESLRSEYGSLVWIFAGYKKDMEKLFEFNPGLPSRFPKMFVFDDYEDIELESIFRSMMQPSPKKPSDTKKDKASDKSKNGNTSKQTQMNGRVVEDEWGNKWYEYRSSRWEDEYGNMCAYGPNGEYCGYNYDYGRGGSLGSQDNPLVSKDKTEWIYDSKSKVWKDRNNQQKHKKNYPGKPQPESKVTTEPFNIDNDKWLRIGIRRLSKLRGTVGFGNARAVRVYFDKCKERLDARVARMHQMGCKKLDLFLFTRDDLLGPKPTTESFKQSKAYKKLQALQGMEKVKNEIDTLIEGIIYNAQIEEEEKPQRNIALNRVFLGNPGTGKTTVAKLYAEILKDLGLLSKGEVVMKTSSDFIGSVMGSSEQTTRNILKTAEGSVLVIDEAYSLNPNTGGISGGTSDPYRAAVIDTLVEQVQGFPGEDRAVIMIGYKQQMIDMFDAANPGLARRFQLKDAITFEDYSDEDLLKILKNLAREKCLKLDLSTAQFAVSLLAKERMLPNFGNAGAVNNLLSRATKYLMDQKSDVLTKEAFCEGGKLPPQLNEEDIFRDMVGCEDIIEKLQGYKSSVERSKEIGLSVEDVLDFNFLFVGSPGTGKTSIARKFGEFFKLLGVLPCSDVVEVSASDLTTGYMGQTGKKTKEVMQSAQGKVLFIDEAYQLNPEKGGSYMQEAVDEIVKGLTSEELKGQMVLILAGYEKDIDDMLEANQGLRSRVAEKIVFENFSEAKTKKLLLERLQKKNLTLCHTSGKDLERIISSFCAMPSFSNGRDIETLSKKLFRATRSGQVSLDILEREVQKMRIERSGKDQRVKPVIQQDNLDLPGGPPLMPMMASEGASAKPRKTAVSKSASIAQEEESPDVEAEEDADDEMKRFTGHLEDIFNQNGWNNAEDVKRLAYMSSDDEDFQDIINKIATLMNISHSHAQQLLISWQNDQKDVQDKLRDQKSEMAKAKKEKRKARVPIWACRVCNRAYVPYIFCHVDPRVVRYDEIEV